MLSGVAERDLQREGATLPRGHPLQPFEYRGADALAAPARDQRDVEDLEFAFGAIGDETTDRFAACRASGWVTANARDWASNCSAAKAAIAPASHPSAAGENPLLSPTSETRKVRSLS
jgi:hypothetical protein